MTDWQSTNNKLEDSDFVLTSKLVDGLDATDKDSEGVWKYCNYDDKRVGAYRDCGPQGFVGWQWTANRGGKPAKFYIYTPRGINIVFIYIF